MARWTRSMVVATLFCLASGALAVQQYPTRGPEQKIAAVPLPKLKTMSPIIRIGRCSGSNSCCCQIGFQANCTTRADCRTVGGSCVTSHPSC